MLVFGEVFRVGGLERPARWLELVEFRKPAVGDVVMHCRWFGFNLNLNQIDTISVCLDFIIIFFC